jgi:hypothetical protein
VLSEGAMPLREENVRKWLGAWRASGFLPPEQKKAIARDNGRSDGQSIDDIPDHRDIEPPLKDVYVLTRICISF